MCETVSRWPLDVTSEENGILHIEHPDGGVLTTRPPSKQILIAVPVREGEVNKVNFTELVEFSTY